MVRKVIRGKEKYYLICESFNSQKYISSESAELIQNIKCRHFLNKSVSVLQDNIKAPEKLLKSYVPYDHLSINDMLPPVYRLNFDKDSPYDKSAFNCGMHRTAFDLCMRSKSEVLIAESLYANNIDFKYEFPLQ